MALAACWNKLFCSLVVLDLRLRDLFPEGGFGGQGTSGVCGVTTDVSGVLLKSASEHVSEGGTVWSR